VVGFSIEKFVAIITSRHICHEQQLVVFSMFLLCGWVDDKKPDSGRGLVLNGRYDFLERGAGCCIVFRSRRVE
jgi:hypothetical protein